MSGLEHQGTHERHSIIDWVSKVTVASESFWSLAGEIACFMEMVVYRVHLVTP
jgi:hypothetical protein